MQQVIQQRELGPAKQRGVVLPLTAISLFALIGIAALSLDISNLFLNKTRLQNTVDAAALTAAKELDRTEDTTAATIAAFNTFALNATADGNHALLTLLEDQPPLVQFSATVNPFIANSGSGPYVRVAASGLNSEIFFARIFGMNQLSLGASAVAGPTPSMGEVCSIAPVVVCGDPNGDDAFGYQYGDTAMLKAAAPGDPDVGPGNFHLIRLEDAAGGDDIRDAMAGIGARCIRTGEPVPTEPGNKVGPVVDGVDARFFPCDFNGTTCVDWDIRPDMVATEGISHKDYEAAYAAQAFTNPDPIGAPERRVIVVPIGNCTGQAQGQDTVPFLGFGCFFLNKAMEQKGNDAFLFGEFLQGCGTQAGTPGPVPNSGSGPYKIVLYKDTASPDS